MEIFNWVQEHWQEVIAIYTGIVAVASIIVKLTPSLKDDTLLFKITRFVAKYLALNTNAPTERPN